MTPYHLKIVIGLLGVVLIGVAGIHLQGAAANAEGKVKAAVEAALSSEDAAWVNVGANGQKVILSGTPPTEAHAEAAVNVTRTAIGRGGPVFGGVTAVETKFALAVVREGEPADLAWRADFDGQVLRISGAAPSESAQSLIAAEAARRFTNRQVDDSSSVVAGGDDGEWFLAASMALRGLSLLDSGEVVKEAKIFNLAGETAGAAKAANASRIMETLPSGYVGDTDITVMADVTPEPEAQNDKTIEELITEHAPEAQPIDIAACQREIDTVLQKDPVIFDSNRTRIGSENEQQLNAVAAIINECAAFATVEGHTDSSGPQAPNQRLSSLRARAVGEYLVRQGVDEDALAAVGYGSARPVTSNETFEGRTRNRRIEIKLSNPESHGETEQHE